MIVLRRGCFPGNFPKFAEQLFSYLCTAAFVIGPYLPRYLRVFEIHFHLNQSISHGCSQVYVISLGMGSYQTLEYIILPYYCFYSALGADLK